MRRKKELIPDKYLSQGTSMIEYYRNHPVLAARDLLNVDLAPIQRIVFRDMWFKSYNIILASRGFGKTFLQAVYAVLKCMLWPGYRVGLIGPVFRQAKHVFDAIDRLYLKAPIFQQACTKPPTKGSDSCYIRFKAPKGADGSWIEGVPLGDGTKIRGARFFSLCIDEFPHVPQDIYDAVIIPFAITGMDPMARVRYFERIERLKAMGVEIDEEESSGLAANKFIHTSSGYYKFNYMWDRMRVYWREIHKGSTDHSVRQVPWWTLPNYFLDTKALDQSRKQMSKALFDMEYNALMVSDSEGFFSAKLLEKASQMFFPVELVGDGKSEYILAIDPASGRDVAAFSMTIVKLGKDNVPHRVVFAKEFKNNTFPTMTRTILDFCEKFNIVRIFMDSQGGGRTIADLLEEGESPILENTSENMFKRGRKILELCNPSTNWNASANHTAVALLESGKLQFPRMPLDKVYLPDKEAAIFESIETMKKQMLNIIVTPTGKFGAMHFDTPTKGQKKDLYSTFILASYGLEKIRKERESTNIVTLCNDGLIHNLNRSTVNNPSSNMLVGFSILRR